MNNTNKSEIGKNAFLATLVLLISYSNSRAQFSYNKNFVSTADVKVPGKYYVSDVNALPNQSKVINIEYIDGLGRSEQKVMVNATAIGVDMISPTKYDNLGRVIKQYLPYSVITVPGESGSFKQGWEADQLGFYQNNSPAILPNDLPDNNPFSISDYEPSPLNRVIKTFAPGNAWAGTKGTGTEIAVKTEFKIYNTGTDLVKTWEYNNSGIGTLPVISSIYTYQTGDLIKTILTDEHGKLIEEYKDKSGNTILKKVQDANNPGGTDPHQGWLCTYYLYDNLNQLRFVLPPKATEWLRNNNWALTQPVIDELCFWYEYDTRGRMITKHVPGAKPVNMVYDIRDRLVFTQDANMFNQQKWMISIYDFLNRPIATAFWNSSLSRATLQSTNKQRKTRTLKIIPTFLGLTLFLQI